MGIDKGSAAALDCPIIPSNSTERLRLKQECGLFFQWGVILKDGARMVDCNIQKFYDGAGIEDGGEIQDSEFSLNWRGYKLLTLLPILCPRWQTGESGKRSIFSYHLCTYDVDVCVHVSMKYIG